MIKKDQLFYVYVDYRGEVTPTNDHIDRHYGYNQRWATLLDFYKGQTDIPMFDETDAGVYIALVEDNIYDNMVYYQYQADGVLQKVKDPKTVEELKRLWGNV